MRSGLSGGGTGTDCQRPDGGGAGLSARSPPFYTRRERRRVDRTILFGAEVESLHREIAMSPQDRGRECRFRAVAPPVRPGGTRPRA